MNRLCSALIVLTALAASILFTPLAAQAEPYKWCAQYTGRGGGDRNCGFVSWEQCMETVRGMGGFCERNAFYDGPADQPAGHKRKHRED